MKDRNKKVILLLVVALLIVVIGTSLALRISKYSTTGERSNSFTTGTLIVNMEDGADLSLVNSYPMADSQVDGLDSYDFTIRNKGTLDAKYEISIIEDTDKYVSDGCSDIKIPFTSLRYSINNGSTTTIDALPSDGKILYDDLASGASKSYSLKLWIKSDATNEVQDKHFHGKLKVKVIPSTSTDYDTGA